VFESDPIHPQLLPRGFAQAIEEPPETPVTARPAATVMILRDATEGLEVLLLKRSRSVGFVPGAYVFPGGRVDPIDAAHVLLAQTHGLDREAAEDRLAPVNSAEAEFPAPVFRSGDQVPAIAYFTAALREAFEETGILLAHGPDGSTPPHANSRLIRDARAALEDGSAELPGLLKQLGYRLDMAALAYVAHWVTPLVEPRRYDTRFFAAIVPPDSEVVVDSGEIVRSLWARPEDALAAHRRGELPMIFPTVRTIEDIRTFTTATEVLEHYRSQPIPRWMPRLELRPEGVVSVVDN